MEVFLGIPFTLVLLVLPIVVRNRWVKFALLSYIVLLIATLQTMYNYPHYIAPGTCLVYFLVLSCLRKIYFFRWRNRATGYFLVWSLPAYHISLILLPIILQINPFLFVSSEPLGYLYRTEPTHWSFRRNEIIEKLNIEKGKHLVVVQYSTGHIFHRDFVFNGADIDNTKIIWARAKDYKQICELLNFFKDRTVWYLEVTGQDNDIKGFYPIKSCE